MIRKSRRNTMALVTATAALPVQRAAVRSITSAKSARPAQSGVKLTVRGRRVVALLALLPIFVAFLLIGTRAAQADATGPTTAVVKVEAGQSLWDVAVAVAPNEDPRSTIWTIKALNGLETSEVQAGQGLIVPIN
ncbi:MAG: LysM peptidoglycan-binding domain-containing protein [Actinobacteria bacterium]|nr:LysM peptidoglycan-binding domain-containing protein [Actinomycetota bacterium]NBO35768.1 LysM peptidoglycan-binding domain-containing protein [Actinomycetota bacterium]